MQLIVLGHINSEIAKAIDIAKRKGAKVIFAESADECINIILGGKSADLLLVDVSFDIDAIIKALEGQRIVSNIIAFGLNASPKDAVRAIKSGAKEFLPLPPDEEIIGAILESISKQNGKLVYKSEIMTKIMHLAEKVAKSDAHVLITGESGTGKEVLASYIHQNSKRSGQNYVRVNCAAIPENLIESELFGHEKGAFTGAMSRRVGKFEESNHGTLLLDEISEMDIKLQAKLLRAIQEKEIDRLGGQSPVKVDLRIIATSNRDLQEEIAKGSFREDLYFRLNVINIELPPLKNRLDDIIDLANFFLEKYCTSNNMKIKIFDEAVRDRLISYSWPGNIRELENAIHRAVLLSDDIIQEKDFIIFDQQVDYEKNDSKSLILNTLKYCLGDVTQASNILGISISSLSKKLESKSPH
ncbi:MAG: sigma-54 dependent transcriptional regulator [Rickettsiaceae bacterium]|nr:sigma-54 dependent transcriptional regulator [Rickettsiaceae bacterium]